MQKFEEKLEELLVKKAPFQIPETGRQWIAKAMPYLALLGGIFALFAAWQLYQAATFLGALANWADTVNSAYGLGGTSAAGLSFMVWVALALLVVEAVAYIAAFSPLTKYQKRGWDILFWVLLLSVAVALVQMVSYFSMSSLLWTIVSTVVGLYILFQVRPYYTGAARVPQAPAAPTQTPTTPPAAKPEDKK